MVQVKRASSLPSCLGPDVGTCQTAVLDRLDEEVHVATATVPRVTSAIFDIELDSSASKLHHGHRMFDRCQSHIDFGQHCNIPFGPQLTLYEMCRPADQYERQLACLVERIWCQGGSFESVAVPAAGVSMDHLASELLAAGYLVQIRQGVCEQRDLRSSMRCLKNQFLVCLGFQDAAEMWHSHACSSTSSASTGQTPGAAAYSGGSSSAHTDEHSHAAAVFQGPCYLEEPLIIDPRFREQFLLANPTQSYSSLMQVVPGCFVGPLSRLDPAVAMLSAEVLCNFRSQGMPLPPWRTREAIMSKWCPKQLEDLARMLRSMSAAAKATGRGDVPLVASHQLLRDVELDGQHRIVAPPPAAAAAVAAAVAMQCRQQVGGSSRPFGGRMMGPIAMLTAPMLLLEEPSALEAEVPPALPAHTVNAAGSVGWNTSHHTQVAAKASHAERPSSSEDSSSHAVKKAKSMLAAALRSTSTPVAQTVEVTASYPAGSSIRSVLGHPTQPWAQLTTVRWGVSQRPGNRM